MFSIWMRCAIGVGIALGVASCAKHELPDTGLLKHFEDNDCGGDWTDASMKPEVLRSVDGRTTTLLVRHPGTCGYELAENPRAVMDEQVLKLDYERNDGDGLVAACICEYRVRFDIETPTQPITKVEFEGETARLREGSRFP